MEPAPASEMALVPQFLGRYEVVDFLGAGSFSRVYLARDSELQRLVALKVPRPERFETQEGLSTFLKEARLIAGLDHPGIVSVYDVGQDNGVQFIVMQYVNGKTLKERIAAGRLPFTQAAEIVSRIADAIHAAHKRQLFHRDLKPANVLLDEEGRPHVVDFGLAVQERQQHRHSGEIAGTLAYMAPEQIRGEAQWLDGRSDVWSLGAILYALLTGRQPFLGHGAKIVDEILNRDPRPPRQIDERIPQELQRICLKCLSKSARDRYSSAFDLAEELKNWLRASKAVNAESSSTANTEETVLAAVVQVRPPSRAAYIKWIVLGIAGVLLLGLVLDALNRPENKTEPSNAGTAIASVVPTKPDTAFDVNLSPQHDPFKIDSFAVPGRWYPLLEQKPHVYFMATWDIARWSHDAQRQELLVNVPSHTYLDLGQTEAEKFSLEVTIASTNWTGGVGFFWGRKEAGTELQQDGQLPQCHRLTLSCIKNPAGKSEARLQRDRVTFKQNPEIKGYEPYNTTCLATEQISLPDQRPQRLQLKVDGEFITVHWNSQEIAGLRAAVIHAGLPPLSAQGPFGLYATEGSFQISDVRFRLDEK